MAGGGHASEGLFKGGSIVFMQYSVEIIKFIF